MEVQWWKSNNHIRTACYIQFHRTTFSHFIYLMRQVKIRSIGKPINLNTRMIRWWRSSSISWKQPRLAGALSNFTKISTVSNFQHLFSSRRNFAWVTPQIALLPLACQIDTLGSGCSPYPVEIVIAHPPPHFRQWHSCLSFAPSQWRYAQSPYRYYRWPVRAQTIGRFWAGRAATV